MVSAFLCSLYLTFYKTDISLRRKASAGPKGVRLRERWLYRGFFQILTLFQTKKCHFSHPFSDQWGPFLERTDNFSRQKIRFMFAVFAFKIKVSLNFIKLAKQN